MSKNLLYGKTITIRELQPSTRLNKMDIEEEIERRRININTDKDIETAYHQAKETIEHKAGFETVEETNHFKDKPKKLIRTKLIAEEEIDKFTEEKITIHLKIKENQVNIQIKGILVTEYPEKFNFQATLWYYMYRSLYDKFLYGNVRSGYKPVIEDKIDTTIQNLQKTL